MKRKLFVAAIAAALFSAAAWAQWGPGMMGGYGPGYGMGPGMMGGGYAQGYGPGMMGGYGPGAYGALDLTDEQRDKIASIQQDLWKKHWALMGAMHELRGNFFPRKDDSAADAQKNYEAMAALQKQMFEASLEARKQIDAVLTKEQQEQLRKNSRRGW